MDDRSWAGPTHPAAVYFHAENRKGEHPLTDLGPFRGTLQVDGYAGFGKAGATVLTDGDSRRDTG